MNLLVNFILLGIAEALFDFMGFIYYEPRSNTCWQH